MKRCDFCDEEWEESFFCEKHSNKVYTEFMKVPVLRWYGVGPEFTTEEVDVDSGNVCFNCCNCNLN